MLQHTKSNNKITNVLNAQGLITLKSTVFALEQVEGKDGDTFSQRNANQHTTQSYAVCICSRRQGAEPTHKFKTLINGLIPLST